MRSERHGFLHGRRGQTRQHRCFVRPRVRPGALIVALSESLAIEQARDPWLHGSLALPLRGGVCVGGMMVHGHTQCRNARRRGVRSV
jgi:hypothetical protein